MGDKLKQMAKKPENENCLVQRLFGLNFRDELDQLKKGEKDHEKNIFHLMQMKLKLKDEPRVENLGQVEEMLGKYYRFKIFWKQEAIKKFLEGHLGIKMNQIREFQRSQSKFQ